jgi:hypothetical protein
MFDFSYFQYSLTACSAVNHVLVKTEETGCNPPWYLRFTFSGVLDTAGSYCFGDSSSSGGSAGGGRRDSGGSGGGRGGRAHDFVTHGAGNEALEDLTTHVSEETVAAGECA